MITYTIGSLFDGIGGFPLAGSRHGITPVWASEIEPFPINVTTLRFPGMKHIGDITKINGAEVEPVDVIIGGSPCQDLSVAGKRAGLDGKRSGLFMEQIRIIKEMRDATNGTCPRYMVWENVPGAFSSNKGEDFRIVLEETAKIADETAVIPRPDKGKWTNTGAIMGNGWSIAWRVFDAQFWGVPQRRRRIYLVADFGSERAGEVLFVEDGLRGDSPQGEAQGQGTAGDAQGGVGRGCGDGCLTPWDVESRRVHRADGIWPTLYGGEGGGHGYVMCLNPFMPESSRIYDAQGIYPTLSANASGGQNRQAVIHDARGNGDGKIATFSKQRHDEYKQSDQASTLERRDYKCHTDLVVTRKQRKYIVRRLTPLECTRLQGYPDWWLDIPGASDSAKYKALGNSLAIPCADFVMAGVKRLLDATSAGRSEE